MEFTNELAFEEALINLLFEKGWERTVLRHKTEKELLQNWANILFENNRSINRLNNYPLTETEMEQIVEQIRNHRTPLKLNGFINGKTVSIKRDNPDDREHFGKEVSLSIYDRQEIAAGRSRYQIAEQPVFPAKSAMMNDRRGDLMLLINGMPVIHIELKRSGVPVSQACTQIEKYSHEGVFTGLFSLVQVFVAMNPEDMVYFANPGPDGKFNKDYFFHWANFNNEPINEWKEIASHFLSIPMAHQLIGFYTVADDTDGVLKVMRSYQYYAASAISDKVAKTKWADKEIYGGYIWHTTGSGKTMTSFKSAQLISNSKDADKVVFLMDRIELGTQSLLEYRGFADDTDSVQATENTEVLLTKLKSSDPANTLIVTSIQKMSNIKRDGSINDKDIDIIGKKRVVFIVDECHRSTFGDMLSTIKATFPGALFFGFTGTPIHKENQRNMTTTSMIFGNELHRYSIADGIRDRNVLGFDPYMVCTYKDRDVRSVVALEQAKAKTVEEAVSNPRKSSIYYKFMNDIPMAGYFDNDGMYQKGIEDYLGNSQYGEDTSHPEKVVEDILQNWNTLSRNKKFHAIFATSSIPEAINYYRLFKSKNSGLKIAALFDQNDNNGDRVIEKEEAVAEMLTDYNAMFDQKFSLSSYGKYKKDVSLRLAHKKTYMGIEKHPEMQLDLLIVVDQMLTGFDSKWVNTLYLDKLLKYENVIQAFSRTNRLFGPDKPFGTIRYYRRPYTMKRNIASAVKLYSGDKPLGLFASRLEYNLTKMNDYFNEINDLFNICGIDNFSRLPSDNVDIGRFANLFSIFNKYLEAAKIQGFVWNKLEYKFTHDDNTESIISIQLTEEMYLTLVQRYKEIPRSNGPVIDIPYEIEGYITEIKTESIDNEYMNSRFQKYLKLLESGASSEVVEQTLNDLHKSFASLTQEEQKYAKLFLGDVERGDAKIEEGKTLRDYIAEYQINAMNDKIRRFAETIGVDENLLRDIMSLHVTEANINEYGRFDKLVATVDKEKAKKFFESKEGKPIPSFKISIKIDNILRQFILSELLEI